MPCQATVAGNGQQLVVDRGGLRTDHVVDRDQGGGDCFEDGITGGSGLELVMKSSPVPTSCDSTEPDRGTSEVRANLP